VSLTFDDGNADNYSVAAILNNMECMHLLYPERTGGQQRIHDLEQLQTLQNDGNEIGGHTLDHIKLAGLDPGTLRHEICDDRKNLIAHGLTPISFAYPFGNYDEQVSQTVKDCGYSNARTILGGPQRMPFSDPYALLAFPYIVNDTGLAKMEAYVGGTAGGRGWVIFIFHHVCDSCDFFSVKPEVLNDYIPWLANNRATDTSKY